MDKLWMVIALVCVYGGLFILERRFPLRTALHPGIKRLSTNILMTVLVIGVVQITVAPTVQATMALSQSTHFGLINLLKMPSWLALIVGFLLLDLSFYYWHKINHKIPLLWRFHNVHHVDQDLDVTTAMRFHWGEIAYSSVFRLIQLILLGVTPITLILYEFIFQLCTFFHHSNLRLPKRFETVLGLLLITPRIHGIHHSNYRQETDSNYGVVLSIWDRLHRTLKRSIPQQTITIGVPAYDKTTDNQFNQLLLLPFKAQRNYWLTSENQPHEQRGVVSNSSYR
ncbi:sterol desaturase family protein [Legionella sp. W05-934-2]|uniref:sterol desaturase family protein n=1 Tax=Legionella sp. W05-934-2 TaxID=1198649 RepID=UPI0034634B81